MRKKLRTKKRIYIVTPFENRMAARGTRLPKLAEMLVENGFDVEYVTTDFSHAYKRTFTKEEIDFCQETLPYQMTVLPIPEYRVNISVKRVLSNIVMALNHLIYLLKAVHHGDVIVAPSRPVEIVALVAIIKFFKKVHIVMDIRDIWPDALQGVSVFKKAIFSLYCNIYLKFSLKRVDSFVHIAPSFVDWLHRYAPNAESTFIPPGFDNDRWISLKPRHLGTGETISLVFVGALQHQLDVMPLLKALVDRPKIMLTLVGDNGTGQRYPEVKEFIDKNRLVNVIMKGRMTPDEVVEELQHHDISVVPMISSSMTNKMFDAIASYLPVLSLGDNDSSDFVKKNNIGWTALFDPKDIGRVLDTLTEGDVNKKAEAVALIRLNFGRELLFKQFIDIIQDPA